MPWVLGVDRSIQFFLDNIVTTRVIRGGKPE
jgi:hypothetical protein